MHELVQSAPMGASVLLSLLDNPGVLDALITGTLVLLGFVARKVLRSIDNAWANEHLAGIGSHAYAAGEVAGRAYSDAIRVAADDGIVTDAERADARKTALDAAMESIGLSGVAKALGISRGAKATEDAAKKFIAEHVERALDDLGVQDVTGSEDATERLRPLSVASSAK